MSDGTRVGLRCDGGPRMGVGHVLRQIALAEEFLARGVEVTMLGTVEGSTLVDGLLAGHGLAMEPALDEPEALLAQVRERRLDAIMLDGYHLSAALGRTLRAAGVPVAAMVDGRFGLHQDADLYVDQNFGATRQRGVPTDRRYLAGIEYALLRDVVRSRRGGRGHPGPEDPAATTRPRILCVFGGTDAYGAARTIVPLLLSADTPVEVVAIAATAEIGDDLGALHPGPDQSLEVLPPVADLPGLAAGCDGVVSAAGSSIWEFFCLGVPVALVAVVDNQLTGYQGVLEADLAAPVGLLPELRRDQAAVAQGREVLRQFTTDPAWRAALGAHGAGTVDGDGRVRVADAMLGLQRIP